jgi:hypothetical protein
MQGGTGGSVSQDVQSGQEEAMGEFKGSHLAAQTPHDGTREQPDLFTPEAYLKNRTVDTTEPASHPSDDRLTRIGSYLKWVLAIFVGLGWMNEQTTKNHRTNCSVSIKNEFDKLEAATPQPSEEAATLESSLGHPEVISESVEKTSSSSDGSHTKPAQTRQESSKPKLAIINPKSEVHTRRREGLLPRTSVIESNDPSKYSSPRSCCSHLNAELLKNGSPVCLEMPSLRVVGGTEWRKVAGEILTTDEDEDALQTINKCQEYLKC